MKLIKEKINHIFRDEKEIQTSVAKFIEWKEFQCWRTYMRISILCLNDKNSRNLFCCCWLYISETLWSIVIDGWFYIKNSFSSILHSKVFEIRLFLTSKFHFVDGFSLSKEFAHFDERSRVPLTQNKWMSNTQHWRAVHMYAYLNIMQNFVPFFLLTFVWRKRKIFENPLLSTSIGEYMDDTSNHTWSYLAFIEWLDNNAEQHNRKNGKRMKLSVTFQLST